MPRYPARHRIIPGTIRGTAYAGIDDSDGPNWERHHIGVTNPNDSTDVTQRSGSIYISHDLDQHCCFIGLNPQRVDMIAGVGQVAIWPDAPMSLPNHQAALQLVQKDR